MLTQRIRLSRFRNGVTLSLRRLIVLASLVLLPASLHAMHDSGSTPPPQGGGPPTKGGSVETASASSGSSGGSFNIQSFHADLFTATAGAEIPILVPPGAAGVAPKIVLRYNSGVVDDLGIEQRDTALIKLQGPWTGLGWTLDTGGFIIRNTKGTTGKADDTFKLVFNGVTHDLVAAGSGRYRTKDETFWLINYVSAGDYWTVKSKDGTLHRFGFSANSRQTGLTFGLNIEVPVTFSYFIDEVTTTSGTAVRYNYFKQSSSYNKKPYDQAVYPDTITYAYRNGSLIGTVREVRFLRASRNDWTIAPAIFHTSYHELYRLDAIEGIGVRHNNHYSLDGSGRFLLIPSHVPSSQSLRARSALSRHCSRQSAAKDVSLR